MGPPKKQSRPRVAYKRPGQPRPRQPQQPRKPRAPLVQNRFYRSKVFGCFKKDGISMKGLCPMISKAFCRGLTTESLRQQLHSEGTHWQKAGSEKAVERSGKLYGVFLGTKVHNEFTNLYAMREDGKTPRVPVHKKPKRLHSLTVAARDKLAAMGLRIVNADVGVWNKAHKTATTIDVLCVNAKGEHVAVELKFGSTAKNYLLTSFKHYMTGCFQGHPISESSMHQLQLLGNLLLYKDAYPHHRVSMAGVLLTTYEHGAQWHPLEEWAWAGRDGMYAAMA